LINKSFKDSKDKGVMNTAKVYCIQRLQTLIKKKCCRREAEQDEEEPVAT